MARMSTRKRKSLPKGDFAGPGRSFPINDRSHASAAISGASRSLHAGNISASTARRIQSKARAKLHKTARRSPSSAAAYSRSYRKGSRK